LKTLEGQKTLVDVKHHSKVGLETVVGVKSITVRKVTA